MKRTLKTARPETSPVVLEQLHQRSFLLPARLVGSLLIGSLMLAGCSEEEQISGNDNSAPEGSKETADSENKPPPDETPSGEGLIDVDGGYTQDEQLAELEIVVETMQEHFGEDVATIDGEPWTAERHDAAVAARPQDGDTYRHAINFDLELTDLEGAYATADEIAKKLGLTENVNNSNGIDAYGGIYYGAGREEGRVFLLTGGSQEVGRVKYRTQRSDDETIIAAYERVIGQFRQEHREQYSSDTPIDPEDLEIDDERTD